MRRRESSGALPMPQSMDRLPPHSIESEQGVLGCILLDPKTTLPLAIERIRTTEAFYDLRHQALFELLVEMSVKTEHIDPITVQQHLRDRNQLEALGGMPYIAGLMECTPSAANLVYYIEILVEKYTLRKMIQLCTSTITRIYDGGEESKGALNTLQKEVMEIDPSLGKSEEIGMIELMMRVGDRMDAYRRSEQDVRGLDTGFPDIDKIFGGMKPGQLIILGARPSVGKSSLAMNIVEQIAINLGHPCGFFSMEMEADELGERLVASRSNVDSETFREPIITPEVTRDIYRAITQIGNSPIYICDKGGMTFNYFRAKLRQMVQKYGIKLAVIDYLQLFHLPSKENRSIEIGAITTGLKALAKELRIPILLLSQLNRDLEKDNRRPRMSDLRDSGCVEQDADKIMLLSEEPTPENKPEKKEKGAKSKPKLAPPSKVEYDPHVVTVICDIPKNRGARRGVARLIFRKAYTRFESIAKIDQADVPSDIPQQGEFQG